MDSPQHAAGYDEELDGAAEAAPVSIVENLADIAEYDGNLLDLLNEEARTTLGGEAVEEYDHDKASRSEWEKDIERAVKAAKQDSEQKNYPFEKASNVKFPILTSAAIQFGSRAYGAMTRGDQPVVTKVLGTDEDGSKTAKAQRLTKFNNHLLMYKMDEWDSGTDQMLHTIPVTGSAFRKVYWSPQLGRCVADYAKSQDVVVNNNSPNFQRAPRQTQPVDYYPYEIDALIASGRWAQHDYERNKENDKQGAVAYLEQLRYIDLDGDGLQEPYIVTVEKESKRPVRIDPAFYKNSLMISEAGGLETILRESPWIDYKFLPDIDGSVYGMGFGKLLESLGSAINSAINQIIDAGTRQNTGGGFIDATLRLKGARGGTMRMNPGEYKFVKAGAAGLQNGIHTLQFPGPSPVQFSLVDFLLGAAQDITAVKDVLTGDAPSGQAFAATQALIEQGLQVFSTIYTRVYRSARRELRLITRLNGEYMNPQAYLEFHDDPKLMEMVRGGYKPMDDFDLSKMDLAPSADPKSVTDMQRLMRSQHLAQFKGQPGINDQEIQRRELEAANHEDIDKLFTSEPDPMMELQAEEQKLKNDKLRAEIAEIEARIGETGAKTAKLGAEAEVKLEEADDRAFERGAKTGLDGEPDGVEGVASDAGLLPLPGADANGSADGMGGPLPGPGA